MPDDYSDLDKYPTLPLGQVGDISPAIGEDDRGYTQHLPVEAKSKLSPRIESDGGSPVSGGSSAPFRGLGGSMVPQAQRMMTPAEMMLEADKMMRAQQAQHEARMAMGPAVHPPVPPAWLQQFMATQQTTPPLVDNSPGGQYLQERDRLRALTALRQ